MSTHPTYEELNDYADALLGDVAHATIDAHLVACAECRSSLEQIRDIQLWAQALPRDVKAPPEVWATVRAATIDDRRAQRRRVLWELRYPLAAAALVLLMLTATITWYVARPQPPVAQENVAPANTHLTAYRAVELEYARAAGELMQLLEQRRATMDPEMVRTVEENLRIMDDAISKARAALLSDPSNQNVAGILAATQESKLRMLRRAIAAPGT